MQKYRKDRIVKNFRFMCKSVISQILLSAFEDDTDKEKFELKH